MSETDIIVDAPGAGATIHAANLRSITVRGRDATDLPAIAWGVVIGMGPLDSITFVTVPCDDEEAALELHAVTHERWKRGVIACVKAATQAPAKPVIDLDHIVHGKKLGEHIVSTLADVSSAVRLALHPWRPGGTEMEELFKRFLSVVRSGVSER